MLSIQEIKRFMEEDKTSPKKRFAKVGMDYYEGKHDILNSRLFYYNADGKLVEDKTRSNIKIPHSFFTELSDQLTSYMLSFTDNPIRAVESAEGLQEHLNTYFNDDFWSEIGELVGGAYNKGFEYLYASKNLEDRLIFECADSLGVVEVPAKYTSDNKAHKIYHYIDTEMSEKGKREVTRIQEWSDSEVYFYIQENNGEIILDSTEPINPRPHVIYTDAKGEKTGQSFGFIPFFKLANNKKEISGLRPVKAIIDDYDLHACSLSNNLVDFDTPLHVVSGYQGDNLDELQTNLKTKKIVGVDENGGVTVQTVDIPYQARKEKLEMDEKNIYRFGMGLNMAGLRDTSSTTNIAIKAAYSLLDMKANRMETNLKKVLKEVLKFVLVEINAANDTDYQLKDVYFKFTREVMTNDTENTANKKTEAEIRQIEINTILNIAAQIGDEKALQLICEQLDIDFEEVKSELENIRKEQELTEVRAMLESGDVVEQT